MVKLPNTRSLAVACVTQDYYIVRLPKDVTMAPYLTGRVQYGRRHELYEFHSEVYTQTVLYLTVTVVPKPWELNLGRNVVPSI